MATINDIVPGGQITQYFGMTEYAKRGAYGGGIHDGLDIAALYGTRINWPLPPTSVRTGFESGGYGNFTVGYHGPYEMLFGHQAQTGNSGYAGLVDSTGNSTGNHTHFRLKLNGVTIDPLPFLENLNMGVPQERLDREIAASRKARRNLAGVAYLYFLGRPPTDKEVDARQDQDPDAMIPDIRNSSEAKKYRESDKLSQAKSKAQEIVNL